MDKRIAIQRTFHSGEVNSGYSPGRHVGEISTRPRTGWGGRYLPSSFPFHVFVWWPTKFMVDRKPLPLPPHVRVFGTFLAEKPGMGSRHTGELGKWNKTSIRGLGNFILFTHSQTRLLFSCSVHDTRQWLPGDWKRTVDNKWDAV